jgi:hypothetical protein
VLQTQVSFTHDAPGLHVVLPHGTPICDPPVPVLPPPPICELPHAPPIPTATSAAIPAHAFFIQAIVNPSIAPRASHGH